MNTMQFLAAQPWVERLGWTLVHFLWQGAGIAALYGGVRRMAQRDSDPNPRYLLSCVALLAMVAAPIFTWSLLRPAGLVSAATLAARQIPPDPPAVRMAVPLLPTAVRATLSSPWPPLVLPWVVVAWLAGAMAFWLRLLGGWMEAARMRSRLVRPAPPEWQRTLFALGQRIGLTRPVRLLVSAMVQVPTVVGWLRPLVLVPVGALAGLPAEHMEALLIHELAHIRRHDYLVNLLQSIAEALLFYHPAVWWVSGHIRSERELCCDDVAARASGDVLTYVRALAELETCRPAHIQTAIAANGGSLAVRIARLLGRPRPESPGPSGPGAAVGAILLALTACGLFGQSDASPRFEVASVKLNAGGDRRGMRVRVLPGGGLLTENATVQLLIQNAFGLQSFQISGGPGWLQSEGYNIEAKGDDQQATQAQVYRKLRSLLEDRFQLKTHRETKELPVYALVAAKNGPKLPQPQEGSCIPAGTVASPPVRGRPPVFECGGIRVMMEASGARLQGGRVSMAEFIRTLSMVMGRPVVDRTGFTGTFDLVLDFTPDQLAAGLPRPMGAGDPGSPAPAADPSGPPPIFTAIQDQLGLRLESSKGPVEVLVIDHVERPAKN